MYKKIIALQIIVILFSFSCAYRATSEENTHSICKNHESTYKERFGLLTEIIVGEFIKPLPRLSFVEAHSPREFAQYRIKRILFSHNSEDSNFSKVDSIVTVVHNFNNLSLSKNKKGTYVLSEDIFHSGAKLILFVSSKKNNARDLRINVLEDNPESRKLVKSLVRCAKNVWGLPER